MKLEPSSSPDWRRAFLKILRRTRKTFEPVIVVRGDAQIQVLRMQEFFISIDAVFVRLGVTCSTVDALMELLNRLDGTPHRSGRKKIDVVVQNIADTKIKPDHQLLFVVDNCNYLMADHLFYLLGLILQLQQQVQFWFFFTESNLKNWRSKNAKDKRVRFFLKNIRLKYGVAS